MKNTAAPRLPDDAHQEMLALRLSPEGHLAAGIKGGQPLHTACDPITGAAAVQHAYLRNVALECGATLDKARLSYCVYSDGGQEHVVSDKPVYVLLPALTGSPRAAIPAGMKASQGDGWWHRCVGSGDSFLLDTSRCTVICISPLGGNGISPNGEICGSTSALELGPLRHRVTLQDGVNAWARLFAEKFGLTRIDGVIGGSLGGDQALAWACQNDLDVGVIMDISGSVSACQDPIVRDFFQLQHDLLEGRDSRESIAARVVDMSRAVPNCLQPGYRSAVHHVVAQLLSPGDHDSALSIARQIGFLRFVTPEFFNTRWLDYKLASSNGHADAFADSQIGSYLSHLGSSFLQRFRPEALATLCRMIASHTPMDAEETAASLLAGETRLVRFSVDGDTLYPWSYQREFNGELRQALQRRGAPNLFSAVDVADAVNGHDHFLTEAFASSAAELKKHLYRSISGR